MNRELFKVIMEDKHYTPFGAQTYSTLEVQRKWSFAGKPTYFRVKPIEWYNKFKNDDDDNVTCVRNVFTKKMTKWCGKVVEMHYAYGCFHINGETESWEPDMLAEYYNAYPGRYNVE